MLTDKKVKSLIFKNNNLLVSGGASVQKTLIFKNDNCLSSRKAEYLKIITCSVLIKMHGKIF